ncbi:alpha-tocopherol transfer protein-like [Cylas formicarius]|uniref:alpha-tocopherol transfer protein-like n=1 Tax=Cylas formicarius TaxID=197179 RepID=UPI002958A0BC|nr:alpha-tocopherol transfer protein-like [Cylas formicarius]
MNKFLDVNELYKRDAKLKKEDVGIIMDWAEKQRHLPKITELQATLALHSCFYRVEAAKNCLDSYFTIRTHCPEIFANSNPQKNPPLKTNMNISFLSVLPEVSPEGYTIFITRLMDTNPENYSPVMGHKIFDMVALLQQHTKGPTNGIMVIMDMKGGVFGHVTKINLSDFKKFMVYLQTAMPIRLMAIHFINVVPFMDKILTLIKPLINKELFEKLHIHSNNDNLYNFIPRECMPSDYGGKGEPLAVLNEKYKQSIYDNQWFFDFQDSMLVDESKRSGPRKNADNLFGFDGTFKKLEVD